MLTSKKGNVRHREFVKRATAIHGKKYKYPKEGYLGTLRTKATIICKIHGPFSQTAHNHLQGQNCPNCYREKKRLSWSTFIKRSREKHGRKYRYGKPVKEFSGRTHVTVCCPAHGEWKITPSNHMRGHGCPSCGRNQAAKTKQRTTEEWVVTAKEVHGDKYDYSKVRYKSPHEKIEIVCPMHGTFWQTASNHVNNKSRCPACARYGRKPSIAEDKIAAWLVENKIRHLKEVSFHGLLGDKGGRLRYDFFLCDYNILLEYDGIHHFKPVRKSQLGPEEAERRLKIRQRNDQRKDEYARKNGFTLVRISCKEDLDAAMKSKIQVYTDQVTR